MVKPLKINYPAKKRENENSIGIAQNSNGFLRIFSLDGRDLSSVPIMNAQEYRGKISHKEIVDYMALDRVEHKNKGLPEIVGIRDIKKVIEIKGINNSGHSIKSLEKVVETSKLVNEFSDYIKGRTKDEVEYKSFKAILSNIKSSLINLNFKDAAVLAEIPPKYCSDEIWKRPEKKLGDFYKEAYRKTKDIKEKIGVLKRLEAYLA